MRGRSDPKGQPGGGLLARHGGETHGLARALCHVGQFKHRGQTTTQTFRRRLHMRTGLMALLALSFCIVGCGGHSSGKGSGAITPPAFADIAGSYIGTLTEATGQYAGRASGSISFTITPRGTIAAQDAWGNNVVYQIVREGDGSFTTAPHSIPGNERETGVAPMDLSTLTLSANGNGLYYGHCVYALSKTSSG